MKKYAIKVQGSDTEYIVDENAHQSWINNEELIPVKIEGTEYRVPRGQFDYFNEVVESAAVDTRDYDDILESFATPIVAQQPVPQAQAPVYQQPATEPLVGNFAHELYEPFVPEPIVGNFAPEVVQPTFAPTPEPLVVKETKKISLANNSGQQSDIEALLTEADEVRAKIKQMKAEIDTPSTDWNNTIEISKIFKKRLTYLENYWGQLIIQIKVYNIYKENF